VAAWHSLVLIASNAVVLGKPVDARIDRHMATRRDRSAKSEANPASFHRLASAAPSSLLVTRHLSLLLTAAPPPTVVGNSRSWRQSLRS